MKVILSNSCIFGDFKKNPKITLYFDPMIPKLDYIFFTTNKKDLKEQYRDAKVKMPHIIPPPI